MINDEGMFASYSGSSFLELCLSCLGDCDWRYLYATYESLYQMALSFHGASLHICLSVQLHRGNNAADDKLSDRPEHASGGGCREVILIVLGLRTSVRTHMFM